MKQSVLFLVVLCILICWSWIAGVNGATICSEPGCTCGRDDIVCSGADFTDSGPLTFPADSRRNFTSATSDGSGCKQDCADCGLQTMCEAWRSRRPIPEQNVNCLEASGYSRNYNGTVKEAKGIPCQHWEDEDPIPHGKGDGKAEGYAWNKYIETETPREAGNSCRNPGEEKFTPWCYVVDARYNACGFWTDCDKSVENRRLESCKIPRCYQMERRLRIDEKPLRDWLTAWDSENQDGKCRTVTGKPVKDAKHMSIAKCGWNEVVADCSCMADHVYGTCHGTSVSEDGRYCRAWAENYNKIKAKACCRPLAHYGIHISNARAVHDTFKYYDDIYRHDSAGDVLILSEPEYIHSFSKMKKYTGRASATCPDQYELLHCNVLNFHGQYKTSPQPTKEGKTCSTNVKHTGVQAVCIRRYGRCLFKHWTKAAVEVGSATQSSNYDTDKVYYASRAVDNDHGGDWHKNTCTSTAVIHKVAWDGSTHSVALLQKTRSKYGEAGLTSLRRQDAWWSVRLVKTGIVVAIEIQNREDCCQDRLADFTINVDYERCAYHAGHFFGRKLIHCDSPVQGRTVTITMSNKALLTLCDVVVYVVPDSGSTFSCSDGLVVTKCDCSGSACEGAIISDDFKTCTAYGSGVRAQGCCGRVYGGVTLLKSSGEKKASCPDRQRRLACANYVSEPVKLVVKDSQGLDNLLSRVLSEPQQQITEIEFLNMGITTLAVPLTLIEKFPNMRKLSLTGNPIKFTPKNMKTLEQFGAVTVVIPVDHVTDGQEFSASCLSGGCLSACGEPSNLDSSTVSQVAQQHYFHGVLDLARFYNKQKGSTHIWAEYVYSTGPIEIKGNESLVIITREFHIPEKVNSFFPDVNNPECTIRFQNSRKTGKTLFVMEQGKVRVIAERMRYGAGCVYRSSTTESVKLPADILAMEYMKTLSHCVKLQSRMSHDDSLAMLDWVMTVLSWMDWKQTASYYLEADALKADLMVS